MGYKETDIVFEDGNVWVAKDNKQKLCLVFNSGNVVSVSDSAYEMTDDGLSLAICRAKYLTKRQEQIT